MEWQRRLLPHRNIALFVAGAAAVLFLVALSPVQREVIRTIAPPGDANSERFGGATTIGQSFRSTENDLTELQVQLRPPLAREQFPVMIRLHDSEGRELRTVRADFDDVDPNGRLPVRFATPVHSSNRRYTFVLEAPKALGRAIAVAREIDGSLYPDGTALRNGAERPGDLAFAAHTRHPRWRLWRAPIQGLRGTLARGDVRLSLLGGLATVVATVLIRRRNPHTRIRPRAQTVALLSGIALAAALFRLPFTLTFPGSNDEGSYLMDAVQIADGIWPFRDTLSKGPLFLVFLTPAALFAHGSLTAARLLTAGAAAVETVLLFFLGRRLGGSGVGHLAATFWAISPVVLAHTSHLLQQPLSLPLVTLAFIVLLPRQTSGNGNKTQGPRTRTSMLAGVLFALATLVRTSSLAFLVVGVVLPLVSRATWRTRLTSMIVSVAGFLATLAVIAAIALPILGPARTTVFFNVEAVTIGEARAGEGASVSGILLPPREILERIMAHGASFFRSGILIVLLWLAFVLRQGGRALRLPPAFSATAFALLTAILLRENWERSFFLPDKYRSAAGFVLLLAILATLAVFSVLLRPAQKNWKDALRDLLATGGSWLALVFLYAAFGRFRQQYHAEFLVPVVLGSALFLRAAFQPEARRLAPIVLTGSLAAFLVFTLGPARASPPTGSISLVTIQRVADVLRDHSSPGDEILTAQGLFTFAADRRLPFGASHPGWYLEERVGTVQPTLRRLFLPDKSEFRRHIEERPIRLAVIDRRTREVYFAYDPDMRALLDRRFRLLDTIDNEFESQPVEIWIRTD